MIQWFNQEKTYFSRQNNGFSHRVPLSGPTLVSPLFRCFRNELIVILRSLLWRLDMVIVRCLMCIYSFRIHEKVTQMVMFQLAMRIFVAYMFLVDRSELYKEKNIGSQSVKIESSWNSKMLKTLGFGSSVLLGEQPWVAGQKLEGLMTMVQGGTKHHQNKNGWDLVETLARDDPWTYNLVEWSWLETDSFFQYLKKNVEITKGTLKNIPYSPSVLRFL